MDVGCGHLVVICFGFQVVVGFGRCSLKQINDGNEELPRHLGYYWSFCGAPVLDLLTRRWRPSSRSVRLTNVIHVINSDRCAYDQINP